MKGRFWTVLGTVLLIGLALISTLLPSWKWLTEAPLLFLGGGIYFERLERKKEIQAQAKSEVYDGAGGRTYFGIFAMSIIVGIGIGWLYGGSWWSLLTAMLTTIAFFGGMFISSAVQMEAEEAVAQQRLTTTT
jgi:hypothetical protein